MNPNKPPEADQEQELEARAAQLVLRRRNGPWSETEQAALDAGLADPVSAAAIRRAERAWGAVGDHASAPELMVLREQALARARRANARRWRLPRAIGRNPWVIAATVAGIAVVIGVGVQLSPYAFTPGVYQTGVGEQKVIELSDHSRVALDTRTRIREVFTPDARIIEISHGQAQFSVAKDPGRPFKVIAGDRTIIAVGTVFTVEYVDREIRVAMLEGKVAVTTTSSTALVSGFQSADTGDDTAESAHSKTTPDGAPDAGTALTLIAGESLRVTKNGSATVTPKADLEAATAWRRGQVIFHAEPLGGAVRRLNRYSRLQIRIDSPELANLKISGVFEAGDTRAFADAIQSYLPVTADYADSDIIRLKNK